MASFHCAVRDSVWNQHRIVRLEEASKIIESNRPPAPPPVPAMGCRPARPLPEPPRRLSRATQTEWGCPVCHRLSCDALAVPCGHEFCMGCLLRRTAAEPTCPLCRSPVITARFSVHGEDDFLQCILSPPGHSLGARRGRFRLIETFPRPCSARGTPSLAEQRDAEPEPSGWFPPDLWAQLLHGQDHLLGPVRPWLRQSLDAIHGPRWWEAREVESITLSTLCIHGPDRDILAQMLQSYLGEYTAPLVYGLIHVTINQCSEAWRLQHSCAARDEDEISVSSSSPYTSAEETTNPSQADTCDLAGSSMEELPLTFEARPTTFPAEQDQLQDVQEEPTVAPGPSTPNQDRVLCQHRHSRKRASESHSSLQPRKRKKKRK